MKSSLPATLVAVGAAMILGPLLLSWQHTGGPPANLFTRTGIGYEWVCLAAGAVSMMTGVGLHLNESKAEDESDAQ